MIETVSAGPEAPASGGRLARRRVLVVCTHLRPGRTKRRSTSVMQPLAGLHVASLIDAERYEVTLHHEDWHGPYDTTRPETYDLVFLSGLQPDFDRMRQLSFHFRRGGSIVVAGGSICTLFPEFAARFFDVVCSGGIDSARDVMEDFERGSLKPIYRSPIKTISSYDVDYSILARSGISPRVHLVEASRGCSFKCTFCVMPSEVGDHATYDLAAVKRAIDNSLESSPRFSFRRLFPLIIFLDNNFSDDRSHMLKVCEMLRADRRIRGWAALVTQNVLADRALIRHLANSKCMTLFAGIESFDETMLRAYNKKQNLSRKRNVLADIEFAERLGIGIGYGYLFDPQQQSAQEMADQIRFVAREPRLPMPVYLSVVAPLAGTESLGRSWRPAIWRRTSGCATSTANRCATPTSPTSRGASSPLSRISSGVRGSSSAAGASCSRPCAASRGRGAGPRSAGMSSRRRTCIASCGPGRGPRWGGPIAPATTRSIRNISSGPPTFPARISSAISSRSR